MDVPGVQYPISPRSQIGGYLEGHESAVDEDRKVSIGLIFYILSDVILAIFFIGSYIFLRGYDNNVRWFPPGTGAPPYVTGFFVMIVCVAGAVAMVLADRARPASQGLFRLLAIVALILFLADLALQIIVLGHLPFTQAAGAFATSYIVLSGYHVYHMLLGCFLGVGLVVRALRGLYHEPTRERLHAAAVDREAHPAVEALDIPPREEPSLKASTAVRIVTYYFIWAATYSVAFWLLVLIQPPSHP